MAEQRQARVALLGPASQNLSQGLTGAGFVVVTEPGAGAESCSVAVLDLAAESAARTLASLRGQGIPLVGLLSADSQTAPEGLAAVVRAPHAAQDLPALLHTLLDAAANRRELESQSEDLAALMDVTAALASGSEPDGVLFHVVKRLARRLTVERCSVVLIEADGTGVVVAASDDKALRDKRIDLALYPEIREVLLSGRALVIDDARSHPLLDPVRAHLEAHEIGAITVIPMASEGVVVGVIFLRSSSHIGFSAREIVFLSTVASAAAVALNNAGRVQGERRQRVAAERELVQLRRYEEIFSHVNDGMAVLDDGGRVLSLNPGGCATLGVLPEQARGLLFPELVAQESAMAATLVWRELSRGARVLSADLRVLTRDGRPVILSVSAGPLRSQNGRVILSFRDVTEARELEAELRKTKEFLERLIDATVDGIVAADLQGNLLLFNKGAENVTGFTAVEMIGRANVLDFYPPGQAQKIMQHLRDSRREGGRQLPPFRGEVVAKNGEVIPVAMSVALIAEGGEETATVGVFRDLRAELRVEGELQNARERLQIAEKAALVSELAGAAAHELNQPLTSVLGFSELLFRRTRESDKGREELAAILREAERMAGIVKKIGKITRYETTAYVGKTRIVDLDRSSDPPPPIVVLGPKR